MIFLRSDTKKNKNNKESLKKKKKKAGSKLVTDINIMFICTCPVPFLLLCSFVKQTSSFLLLFIQLFFRPRKIVIHHHQRRKQSLSISTLKRVRTGWLCYSQVGMLVNALPKSTSLLTTASPVAVLCVSKRAQDPVSSVAAWYISLKVLRLRCCFGAFFVILLVLKVFSD